LTGILIAKVSKFAFLDSFSDFVGNDILNLFNKTILGLLLDINFILFSKSATLAVFGQYSLIIFISDAVFENCASIKDKSRYLYSLLELFAINSLTNNFIIESRFVSFLLSSNLNTNAAIHTNSSGKSHNYKDLLRTLATNSLL
jgi:hypothetical protein